MSKKAMISEIFDSVQGEGLYLGERQLFVRFFGCNLFCKFCDTPQKSFSVYAPEELLEEIKLYPKEFHSISFTGGEPLLHMDFLQEVLRLTSAEGYRNYLETNGTLPGELAKVIDLVDIVSMDIKLPSSAGMGMLWGMHRKFLEVASKKEVFVKVVVCQESEEGDLRQAIALIKEAHPAAVLILQPNSQQEYEGAEEKLARWQDISLREGVTACVIPQMHNVIGVK